MTRHKKQSAYLHKQEEWKELYESGMSYTQIGKLNGVHYTTVQTVLRGVVKPRPKQKYAHLTEEWVRLYEGEKWSINQIGEKYKADPITVSKYLKKAGVELRKQYGQRSPYEELIPKWIEQYQSGKSLKDIADEFNTYPQTVHKHIHDKVEMREYEETSRLYEIQHPDYLQTIDTHEKAYWLGIWYGTGFVSKSFGGYESSLVLSYKDKQTIEKFHKQIGYQKPIDIIKDKTTHIAKTRIHSKTFYEILTSHGLQENKADISTLPSSIPSEYLCSFALGYYEGKGSAYFAKSTTKGKEYRYIVFSLFGNEEFLTSLHQVIQKQVGVTLNQGVNVATNPDKQPVPYIETGSKEKVKAIADWLYLGNTTYSKHRDLRELLKEI